MQQGIDCIDGCRFALVFPIVVAHFARFSTNNLTALKLLTQEMGMLVLAGQMWSEFKDSKVMSGKVG